MGPLKTDCSCHSPTTPERRKSMGFFDSPEQKQKQKTTMMPSEFGQSIQQILARYLLMRLASLGAPQTFGQFRQQGPWAPPAPTILPSEQGALPGVGNPPAGVNPVLLRYNPNIRSK